MCEGREQLRKVLAARAARNPSGDPLVEFERHDAIKTRMARFLEPLCAALARRFESDSTVRRLYVSELAREVEGFSIRDFTELDALRCMLRQHFNGRVRVEGDAHTIGYFFQIV